MQELALKKKDLRGRLNEEMHTVSRRRDCSYMIGKWRRKQLHHVFWISLSANSFPRLIAFKKVSKGKDRWNQSLAIRIPIPINLFQRMAKMCGSWHWQKASRQ